MSPSNSSPSPTPGSFSHANVAVIAGTLSRDPAVRDLPSGTTLANLEVTCRVGDWPTSTVPVAVFDPAASVTALSEGDPVVVVGIVRRRWYRAGGATQSRTEVVASSVTPGTQRSRWRPRVATAVAALAGD